MHATITRMRSMLRTRRSIIILGFALLMVLSLAAPVGADDDDREKRERITISGDSVPSGCNDGRGAGAIELSGDLDGCLIFFPKRFTCDELNGFALYREWGRELFEGTFDGEPGTFRTKYTLEATYEQGACAEFDAGGFPFEKQITGGCDHRVIGRSGVFDDARGLITFHDVIDPGNGATNYLYSGHLRLDD